MTTDYGPATLDEHGVTQWARLPIKRVGFIPTPGADAYEVDDPKHPDWYDQLLDRLDQGDL